MQEDLLNEAEIEEAITAGRIIRIQKDQFARTVYTIEGTTHNLRKVRVICRFSDSGQYIIIITVYEII